MKKSLRRDIELKDTERCSLIFSCSKQNQGQQAEVIKMKISPQYKEDLLNSRVAQPRSRLTEQYNSLTAGIQASVMMRKGLVRKQSLQLPLNLVHNASNAHCTVIMCLCVSFLIQAVSSGRFRLSFIFPSTTSCTVLDTLGAQEIVTANQTLEPNKSSSRICKPGF